MPEKGQRGFLGVGMRQVADVDAFAQLEASAPAELGRPLAWPIAQPRSRDHRVHRGILFRRLPLLPESAGEDDRDNGAGTDGTRTSGELQSRHRRLDIARCRLLFQGHPCAEPGCTERVGWQPGHRRVTSLDVAASGSCRSDVAFLCAVHRGSAGGNVGTAGESRAFAGGWMTFDRALLELALLLEPVRRDELVSMDIEQLSDWLIASHLRLDLVASDLERAAFGPDDGAPPGVSTAPLTVGSMRPRVRRRRATQRARARVGAGNVGAPDCFVYMAEGGMSAVVDVDGLSSTETIELLPSSEARVLQIAGQWGPVAARAPPALARTFAVDADVSSARRGSFRVALRFPLPIDWQRPPAPVRVPDKCVLRVFLRPASSDDEDEDDDEDEEHEDDGDDDEEEEEEDDEEEEAGAASTRDDGGASDGRRLLGSGRKRQRTR